MFDSNEIKILAFLVLTKRVPKRVRIPIPNNAEDTETDTNR